MHSMLHFFLFLLLVGQSLAMPTHVNMLHKRFDRFCGDKDARQGNDCPNGHNYEFVPKLSGSKVKMHVTKGPKPTGFNCDHTIELQWLVQMTNKALEEETSPLCEGLLANDQKLYKQLAAIINDKSNLWNIPKNMNQVKKWYWTNPEITSTTWPRLGGVQPKTKARTLRGLLSYQTQVRPKMQRNVPNSGIDSSTWPQEFDAYISRMTKQVRKDIDHLDPCDDNVQGSSSTRTVRRWIGSILGAREADGASQAGERQSQAYYLVSATFISIFCLFVVDLVIRLFVSFFIVVLCSPLFVGDEIVFFPLRVDRSRVEVLSFLTLHYILSILASVFADLVDAITFKLLTFVVDRLSFPVLALFFNTFSRFIKRPLFLITDTYESDVKENETRSRF
ncbi:hypothetical protein FA10DRAFT_259758 [Acaromyces ingoldii]|uniref:Uncharacterized protein n=1 Tax=Acaromyces ingoldii TaxID=215250 RepID=A0A316YLS9_9BASI|nr:hypothetical protein FA10DRAFT_259758 [Acaromyces ingoldii]PWN89764.1 hypothetical protein FA10DRAFT_259758 [Acaromyces ingoldii]